MIAMYQRKPMPGPSNLSFEQIKELGVDVARRFPGMSVDEVVKAMGGSTLCHDQGTTTTT